MKKVYLDYAATAPVKPEVLRAMMPYFSQKFGNPSSIHSFGRETKSVISNIRIRIAKFLNCSPEEVIFTSGGTESDNLAIRGIAQNFQFPISNFQLNSKSKISNSKRKPHIITSSFEHHAVLDTCKDLEKRGLAEVTYVKPDKEGIVGIEDIKKALKPNTVLISIMYVNNEIGTVQPIQEIAEAIFAYRISPIAYSKSRIAYSSDKNHKRYAIGDKQNDKPYAISHKLYFHTDAVQAVEYQNCDVKKLGVDMLSLSAHKFGGPKGVGVLYIKKGTPIHHQNIGGDQEFRLRAGTENVAGIVGMGKALELIAYRQLHTSPRSELCSTTGVANHKNNKPYAISHMLKLQDYFIDEAMKKIPDVRLNGSRKYRNPNNINLTFKYVEGESILIHLDQAGIAASSGSACTSGALEPSHVLKSIGLSDLDAHGSIRFTLGEGTTKDEIDYVLKVLPPIIKKLREMSPFSK